MTSVPKPEVKQPIVEYDSREEITESDYQVRWSKVMDQGRYRSSSLYKKIEVLMLRWADVNDNLNITGEVNDLKDVFERDFNYHVTIEHLKLSDDLQVKLNFIVARWIEEHNDFETLLLVYYAGHGQAGTTPGELRLLGYPSPNDEKEKKEKHDNYIIWNKTEELLKAAKKPDVLQIFDCCYAGFLGLVRAGTRTFEYIAATQHDKTTAVPGDQSFTSALIWSLQKLKKSKPEGRFTTAELLSMIKNDAPNFPKDQEPVLFERENANTWGRIMLHPLCPVKAKVTPSEQKSPQEEARRHCLTLHFELSEKLDEEYVEAFGFRVNQLFESNTFGVHRVRWGGMQPSRFAHAVKHFRASLNEFRRMSHASGQKRPDIRPLTPLSDGRRSPATSQLEASNSAVESSTGTAESSPILPDSGRANKRVKRNHHEAATQLVQTPTPARKRARVSSRNAQDSGGKA